MVTTLGFARNMCIFLNGMYHYTYIPGSCSCGAGPLIRHMWMLVKVRLVRLLLENGADPNRVDVTGSTPLGAAVAKGEETITKAHCPASQN